ncbi:MAG: hypothetical protein VW879_11910, partial [Opitutae bacterium]
MNTVHNRRRCLRDKFFIGHPQETCFNSPVFRHPRLRLYGIAGSDRLLFRHQELSAFDDQVSNQSDEDERVDS